MPVVGRMLTLAGGLKPGPHLLSPPDRFAGTIDVRQKAFILDGRQAVVEGQGGFKLKGDHRFSGRVDITGELA